jgi:hypothetical protein
VLSLIRFSALLLLGLGKILVVDAGGVIVQSRDFTLMQGTNNLSLDLSSLHAGYYTLAIQWMSGKQDILNILKQ